MNSILKSKGIEVGIAYGLLLFFSVFYFEYKAGFILRQEYIALFAYIPVVIVAFFVGVKFAYWYNSIEGESSNMEIFLVRQFDDTS